MSEIINRTWMERARRDKGYTQSQVAAAAGVTTAYYNRIENGFCTPNVIVAIKVCDFLHLNVREFLKEKPFK